MSSPTTAAPTLIGGRYAVERQLGVGATATVYLCRDRQTGNDVAVKVLRTELAESVGAERFLREIRLTAGLEHPDIVSVLDSGADGSILWCVLPYMEGGTLRDRLLESKQLPLEEAVRIGATLARALAYAHSKGLIHRDIKPENILSSRGRVYLGDFGIARLLYATAGEMTTTTGVVRGTPAYMSPEQASGERNYDGRSDVYSLASVVYEMISGMPPFVGPTAQSVLAQRFSSTPRPMKVYRNSVSPQLEQVIAKAMSTSPADRQATAGQFADELEAAGKAEAKTSFTMDGTSIKWIAGGILAVLAVFVSTRIVSQKGGDSTIGSATAPDTTQLAVLPFDRVGNADRLGSVEAMLYDALSAWGGVTVLEPFRVRDAVQRNSRVSGVELQRKVALDVHAGRYVTGVVISMGNGWRIRAQLRDLRDTSDKPLKEANATIHADLSGLEGVYVALARALLIGNLVDSTDSPEASTTSLSAMQSFASAISALDDWDFPKADSALQRAIGYDASYSRAYLWQAQVRSWQPAVPVTSWKPLVDRSLVLSARLSSRERRLGAGLQALAARNYEEACRVYQAMLAKDSRDFAALYGLGQCHDRDTRVVRDSKSPTGWRYVSSYQEALDAYRQAFEVLALSHRSFQRGAYEPLRSLLYIDPGLLRTARAMPPDTAEVLVGRLDHDGQSLVMRPYPLAAVQAGGISAVPRGLKRAIDQQKRLFAQIAGTWSISLPNSPGAKEAVAVALEMRGDKAARDTMRVALALATDSLQRLRLSVAELILATKFAEVGEVATMDSIRERSLALLASHPRPSRVEARILASVAALVGRCEVLREMIRQSPPSISSQVPVPDEIVATADALGSSVALGCIANPASEVVALRRRVAAADASNSPMVESTLIGRTIRLMHPFDSTLLVASIQRSGGDYLMRAQLAALRGDRVGARKAIDAVTASRELTGYDAVQPEAVYAESRVLLAIGDSARAAQMLDALLSRRGFLTPGMFEQPIALATLLQSAALRGALAGARREKGDATRWTEFVTRLWQKAGATGARLSSTDEM